MASAGDHYENEILDSILGDDHGSRFPGTVYLALFTVSPTDSTFGTEVDLSSDYDRLAITNDSAEWPDAASGVKANAVAHAWAAAASVWGLCVAWALMDHATAAASANIIFWSPLSPTVNVTIGTAPNFPIGSITIGAD